MEATWGKDLNHKSNTKKKKILDATLELALEKNLKDITISDTLNKVKINSVTFYKYYKSIYEILFSVQIKLSLDLLEVAKEEVQKGNNALKKKQLLKCITNQYQTASAPFHFINLFDSKSYPPPELEDKYKAITGQVLFVLQELIEEGIQNGSFRKDIDSRILSLTITNIILGTLFRLTSRDAMLEKKSINYSDQILQHLGTFISNFLSCK
ncbi:TetR/AcrR family transcriptional regulator [Bacillus cereus group sp. BfR-BA-01379]|uniref:TetR/AcrR family transcriptional regulator n=1 Tax=Bacillus cereus group sp. BfR-BA-01379 TaxID=2920323 RepID=UPI001F55C0EC|nr:TetR/AcrR family transcriptional regulator [Bacillus cereus group sp. BfR-BA-01379]